MNTNKFFVFFIPKKSAWIFAICVIFMIIILSVDNYKLGAACATLLFGMGIYYYKNRKEIESEFDNFIEGFSMNLENAAKDTMLMISVPIAVVEINGKILWKNSFFSRTFDENHRVKEWIQELVSKISDSKDINNEYEINEQVDFDTNHFKVMGRVVDNFEGKDKKIFLLYFFENTENHKLIKKISDEKTVICSIILDNYDDLMQSMDEAKRPQMLAAIDAAIVTWANTTGGLLKKYERDRYIFIFQNKYLKEFEDKKFDIIEHIKDINHGNKIPVTLSMGIDNSSGSYAKSFQYAMAALEIALGRGGDQVVVRNGDNIQFFGGKTREIEKRTRVKARVIGHALREIINHSAQIMIMGHANCDIDSLGAAIGVYKIAHGLGKDVHIVLSASNATIDPFIQKISKIKEYDGVFIGKNQAIDLITKNTVLIVVDTHRPVYTECPELLKFTQHIVVLDHHRRGADFIQDAVLTYQEPYASSTCELVTEIIQYIEDTAKIDTLEAELLYAGIVVDTKGFTFKTGVRTFEAAAFLRKKGVDTIQVKQLLQNDLESYINISNIVKEVKIIHNHIALSVCPPNVKNSTLIAAQAADQILGITGIGAAFVATDTGNGIFISGRSLGEINVQVILEKIGGGGHQTVAGAQLYNEKIDNADIKLRGAIEEYLKEVSKDS